MVAHRLDMDTSGLVAFARTAAALRGLHASFREREVDQTYEAMLCGHLPPNVEGESIDLLLQRDHRRPPFMRCATPESEAEAEEKEGQKRGGEKGRKKRRPRASQRPKEGKVESEAAKKKPKTSSKARGTRSY